MQNNSRLTTKKNYAVSFARLGLYIFPLLPQTKKPAISEWEKESTTDIVKISNWWTKNPYYNIGVATGPSGMTVIDFDVDSEGAEYASEFMEELLGYQPDTLIVKTRSGGLHFYFRGTGFRNSVCLLGAKIDVRANGGYVVGPGSFVQADSKPAGYYEILNDSSIIELPKELYEKLADIEVARSLNRKPTGNYLTEATPRQRAELEDLLHKISADCDYDRYRNVIWSILSTSYDCSDAIALEWSKTSPHRFDQKTFDDLLDNYDPNRSPTIGSLVFYSKQSQNSPGGV